MNLISHTCSGAITLLAISALSSQMPNYAVSVELRMLVPLLDYSMHPILYECLIKE